MSRVVTTAGKARDIPQPRNARREAISRIRAVLRDTNAQDNDADEALEALIELARSED